MVFNINITDIISSIIYLNFQIKIGTKVAVKKDRNNKDCETKLGKISIEKIKPINILFEKSGDGNKRKPTINPIIIDKYAFFSDKFLL